MDGAGGEMDEIADRGRERVQTIGDVAGLKRLPEFGRPDTRLESGVDAALRRRGKDEPCFRLARFAGQQLLHRVRIGMNLYGQPVGRIQQFD